MQEISGTLFNHLGIYCHAAGRRKMTRRYARPRTRRVAMEISRRPRQSLEAGRGIDCANRRQAIRPAAGFVVARSASRSGSEGHFANRRSLTSTAPAVHIGLRVPPENTPRTRTAATDRMSVVPVGSGRTAATDRMSVVPVRSRPQNSLANRVAPFLPSSPPVPGCGIICGISAL